MNDQSIEFVKINMNKNMNTMMKKKYQSPATEVLNLGKDHLRLLAGSEKPGASTGQGTAHSRGNSAGWDEGEDY